MGASQPGDATKQTVRLQNLNQQQDPGMPEQSAEVQIGKELLVATRPFANESVSRSWRQVISTFILMIAALVGAGMAPWLFLDGVVVPKSCTA